MENFSGLHLVRYFLGMRVDVTTYDRSTSLVMERGKGCGHGYVCIANVHMVMESFDDPEFRKIVNRAELVTPDGMPIVWGLRLMGVPGVERVYGPTLTLHICREASFRGLAIGFYGGDDETLDKLVKKLSQQLPDLHIAYRYSPPFRSLSSEEDNQVIEQINTSGARILFVGLGCPKQEKWMASHAEQVNPIMIGVGAAFDFIAGVKVQAPTLVQRFGLEWLFRLATEPKRLWRRYLYHNPRFVLLFAHQLLTQRERLGSHNEKSDH